MHGLTPGVVLVGHKQEHRGTGDVSEDVAQCCHGNQLFEPGFRMIGLTETSNKYMYNIKCFD